MGGRLRPEERIARFADKIDRKLRADEQSETSMRVFTDSSLRRVLKDCGYAKRGARNVAAIEQALGERNVFSDPPLTSKDLDWETRIYFTRRPPTGERGVERVRFPAERDLEDFLEANFRLLFPGLRLIDRQYPVQSGQIDMLARDRDGYVVIELKRGLPTERLVRQLIRYMDDVAEHVTSKGEEENVRGVVVAAGVDSGMHEDLEILASARGRTIDWLEYRVDFELKPAKSQSGKDAR